MRCTRIVNLATGKGKKGTWHKKQKQRQEKSTAKSGRQKAWTTSNKNGIEQGRQKTNAASERNNGELVQRQQGQMERKNKRKKKDKDSGNNQQQQWRTELKANRCGQQMNAASNKNENAQTQQGIQQEADLPKGKSGQKKMQQEVNPAVSGSKTKQSRRQQQQTESKYSRAIRQQQRQTKCKEQKVKVKSGGGKRKQSG